MTLLSWLLIAVDSRPSVTTTAIVITASTTAYSAIVWPDSSRMRSSIEVIIPASIRGLAVERGAKAVHRQLLTGPQLKSAAAIHTGPLGCQEDGPLSLKGPGGTNTPQRRRGIPQMGGRAATRVVVSVSYGRQIGSAPSWL